MQLNVPVADVVIVSSVFEEPPEQAPVTSVMIVPPSEIETAELAANPDPVMVSTVVAVPWGIEVTLNEMVHGVTVYEAVTVDGPDGSVATREPAPAVAQ